MMQFPKDLRRRVETFAAGPDGGRPPLPIDPRFWRSPLRSRRFTSILGLTLLVMLTLVIVCGLLSYASYNPRLAGNDPTGRHGLLGFYFFTWPTHPVWLYRLTQSTHVLLGLASIPFVLAKLWSVIPKLFELPPVRSPAQAIERISLLALVGGVTFEFVTGVMNIQLYYAFPFSFYTAHLYGAWIFLAGFVVHVAVKLPVAIRAVRRRGLDPDPEGDQAAAVHDPDGPDDLRAVEPAPATITRRGALIAVGGGSALLVGATLGQSFDGPLRRTALLAPHGQAYGNGPNDFPVNKTAAYRGITADATGAKWRLELRGTQRLSLDRAALLARPQSTHRLPIACVEGWSTEQEWTGIPLADLASMAGVTGKATVLVESLQKNGSFGKVRLAANQVADRRTLLALKVNGADLEPDHGFPARIIVPAGPGVHNTKWVTALTFVPEQA